METLKRRIIKAIRAKLPDAEVAKKLQCSRGYVGRIRWELGFAGAVHPGKGNWITRRPVTSTH